MSALPPEIEKKVKDMNPEERADFLKKRSYALLLHPGSGKTLHESLGGIIIPEDERDVEKIGEERRELSRQ